MKPRSGGSPLPQVHRHVLLAIPRHPSPKPVPIERTSLFTTSLSISAVRLIPELSRSTEFALASTLISLEFDASAHTVPVGLEPVVDADDVDEIPSQPAGDVNLWILRGVRNMEGHELQGVENSIHIDIWDDVPPYITHTWVELPQTSYWHDFGFHAQVADVEASILLGGVRAIRMARPCPVRSTRTRFTCGQVSSSIWARYCRGKLCRSRDRTAR